MQPVLGQAPCSGWRTKDAGVPSSGCVVQWRRPSGVAAPPSAFNRCRPLALLSRRRPCGCRRRRRDRSLVLSPERQPEPNGGGVCRLRVCGRPASPVGGVRGGRPAAVDITSRGERPAPCAAWVAGCAYAEPLASGALASAGPSLHPEAPVGVTGATAAEPCPSAAVAATAPASVDGSPAAAVTAGGEMLPPAGRGSSEIDMTSRRLAASVTAVRGVPGALPACVLPPSALPAQDTPVGLLGFRPQGFDPPAPAPGPPCRCTVAAMLEAPALLPNTLPGCADTGAASRLSGQGRGAGTARSWPPVLCPVAESVAAGAATDAARPAGSAACRSAALLKRGRDAPEFCCRCRSGAASASAGCCCCLPAPCRSRCCCGGGAPGSPCETAPACRMWLAEPLTGFAAAAPLQAAAGCRSEAAAGCGRCCARDGRWTLRRRSFLPRAAAAGDQHDFVSAPLCLSTACFASAVQSI